jgi:hypothetical protein
MAVEQFSKTHRETVGRLLPSGGKGVGREEEAEASKRSF